MPSLSLLTYNIYAGPPLFTSQAGSLEFGTRLRRQLDDISKLSPDIVCLQEVLADAVRRRIIHRLGSEYDACYVRDSSARSTGLRLFVHALLVSTLSAAMYAAARIAWHATADWGWATAAGVLAWLVVTPCCHATSKTILCGFISGDTYPVGLLILTKKATLRTVGSPLARPFRDQDGDWMNLVRPRGVLWQRVVMRADGGTLWIANTHADALSTDMVGKDQAFSVLQPSTRRRRQLTELFTQGQQYAAQGRQQHDAEARSSASSAAGGGSGVLIAGDFNTSYGDGEFSCFKEKGFVDAWRAVHDTPCYTFDCELNPLAGGGHWSKCRETFDYVFMHARSGFKVGEARLVMNGERPPSDHFGVLVRVDREE